MPPGFAIAAQWDCLLTAGYRVFGTAVDDAHTAAHRDRKRA